MRRPPPPRLRSRCSAATARPKSSSHGAAASPRSPISISARRAASCSRMPRRAICRWQRCSPRPAASPAAIVCGSRPVSRPRRARWSLPRQRRRFIARSARRRGSISLSPSRPAAGSNGCRRRPSCSTARGWYGKGLLHEAWRIRVGRRLVWADALRLEGEIRAQLDAPVAFAGARVLATVVYVAADASGHLPLARSLAENGACRGGASVVNGVLLARFLGQRADAVRCAVARYVSALRHAAAGWPAAMPPLWNI